MRFGIGDHLIIRSQITRSGEHEAVALDDLAGLDRRSAARTSGRRTRTCGTRRARRTDRPPPAARRGATRRTRGRRIARSSTFGFTHVSRARKPPATISRAASRCRIAEQRKHRRQPGAGEPLLAIAPDVFEKQIAERHVREAFGDRARDRGRHRALVDLVRTRRRNRNLSTAAARARRPAPAAARRARRASPPADTSR